MSAPEIALDLPPSRWERPLIAGGIGAGACFLASMALFIGLIVPHMPPIDAPPATLVAFYATQATSPIYAATRLLIFAQLALLPLLFGGLYPVLRRAEGGSGALASAVFAAGLIGAVFAPIVELIEGKLLLGLAATGADPLVAIQFDGMTPIAFGVSGFMQLVVLIGVGLLLGHSVARWVSWLGYLAALLGLAGAAVIVAQPFFAFALLGAIVYKIWMIALSVALLRRPQPLAGRQPAPAAARLTKGA